jgi:hypothetical protein
MHAADFFPARFTETVYGLQFSVSGMRNSAKDFFFTNH